MERFHDHPAITPEVYAQGLINSGDRSTQNPIFNFLLGEADQDDLNTVKKDQAIGIRPQVNSRKRLKMLLSLPNQVEID